MRDWLYIIVYLAWDFLTFREPEIDEHE